MIKTKNNVYITKEEAILAMRSGRNKEESEWAIRSVPATKVKRSLKVTETYIKGKAEELSVEGCSQGVLLLLVWRCYLSQTWSDQEESDVRLFDPYAGASQGMGV